MTFRIIKILDRERQLKYQRIIGLIVVTYIQNTFLKVYMCSLNEVCMFVWFITYLLTYLLKKQSINQILYKK